MNNIKFLLATCLLFLPLFSGHTRIESEPANTARMQDYDYVSQWPRRNNPIHMVVAFTRFKDEETVLTGPPDWASKLFSGETGSVPDYFNTVSHGQIKVTGEVLPTLYELPREKSFYGVGINQSQYVNHALTILDADIDFTRFDSDGPDGVPGSDDDDGYVDYLVLMPISQPYDFIQKNATGLATLGNAYYTTNDKNETYDLIKIDAYSGCLVNGANYDIAFGTLCHEYIHSFGAYDLYDLYYNNEEEESAGVGFWCIMGNGTIGWDWDGGPVMPSAYTRMLIGCIGENNDRLIDIYGIHRDVRIGDVAKEGGEVYRVWIDRNEYFLVEYRKRSTWYDREIPGEGLTIWHILDQAYLTNGQEEMKRCDLECADGLYRDAGYPLGQLSDNDTGRDNLDYWSRNVPYATAHAGNLGDATDLYDGVRYRSFGPYTNPSSDSNGKKETGIEIFNIRQDGEDMLFDINTAPFIDWSKVKFPLIGTGFNRFNMVYRDLPSIEKASAVYLVNYSDSRKPEKLVAVSDDSLFMFDLSGAELSDVQALIERTVLGENPDFSNAEITRENIPLAQFADVMAGYGILPDSPDGQTPAWVQKVLAPVSAGDRPEEIRMYPNYPNPFNAETTISYMLLKGQNIRFELFSITGQKVRSIDQGYRPAGYYQFRFDAEGLSSGMYFYRIAGERASETGKLVFLR